MIAKEVQLAGEVYDKEGENPKKKNILMQLNHIMILCDEDDGYRKVK